jgi:alkyl sulfatase BDS1-like metallo-beta-lactamase superfamily hydrolase
MAKTQKSRRLLIAMLAVGLWSHAASAQPANESDATQATAQVLEAALQGFDWTNRDDFDAAQRGLEARYPEPVIMGDAGQIAWRFRDDVGMREAPAPATVHPLLWRQQQLNSIHGLFRVSERVWQLRGFDLANMTIIEGDSGIIVVDPLTTVEVARAALQLYFTHRGTKPVVAVIYTHSHMDHFGGVQGVISNQDVTAGRVQVIAPRDFTLEAVSENVTAGNAMLRRTIYFSGLMLTEGPEGSVGAGLGPGVSNGRQSFIPPTEEIEEDIAERVIDGVRFVFMSVNGTEAPSEFVFFLPQFGILNVSEVAVRTMHNVLTPRGAKVRDAALWWQTIDRMITQFGAETEILIGQHHWPAWGQEAALAHLARQRDLYKAVHDRTLHMANAGATMTEIGAEIERPGGLAAEWSAQDHYGTFGSAGRATYQYYLGWYDGNPAHLDPLPLAESAVRYVEYMGGAQAILVRARTDFAQGRYQWVAEVLNRLIFADPANAEARELQAQTLTQLGYQQSSATWRNVYLTAARELRHGVVPIPAGARAEAFLANMSSQMLLDFAGIALSPARSSESAIELTIDFGGTDGVFAVQIAGGLLRYSQGANERAEANVVLSKLAFDQLLTRRIDLAQAMEQGLVSVEGDTGRAAEFFTLFDRFTPDFNIVTP